MYYCDKHNMMRVRYVLNGFYLVYTHSMLSTGLLAECFIFGIQLPYGSHFKVFSRIIY